MNGPILAFDTSTEQVAIALARVTDDAVVEIATCDYAAPRAALSRLLPSVEDLLAANDVRISDLSAIVVGRGPGSFTGVRIAVASAKGLAHGAGIPLFGVSTLDAVARRLGGGDGLLGVLGDAMRGEVYPALYRRSGGTLERIGSDRVLKPDVVAAEWSLLGEPLLLAGNGLAKYAGVFAGVGDIAPPEAWAVTGSGLLAAFGHDRAAGLSGDGDVAALLPVYTRLSDAEENERARTDRVHDDGLEGPGRTPGSGVLGPDRGTR